MEGLRRGGGSAPTAPARGLTPLDRAIGLYLRALIFSKKDVIPLKTVGFRSFALYILLFAFLGGVAWLMFGLFTHGSQWAMQPYNGHIYADDATVTLGDIQDRDGVLLASTQSGQRVYCEDEDRKSVV